jgi:hypothetical protein
MKKALGVLIAAVLVISPLSAFAAVKAGDSCKKVGATATASGKKFTCIKSGKKLVWNKGVAVAKPKPVQTPTPTPTPAPTATPTPTPEPTPSGIPTPTPAPVPAPIIEKVPTGFDDLVENYRGIPGAVWNEAQKLATSGSEKTTFELEFGPNTKLQTEIGSPLIHLNMASRLWTSYSQPKSTKAFFYNFADLRWVQDKNRALGGSWHKPEDLASNCTSANNCSSFGGAYQGLGQLFLGLSTEQKPLFNLGFIRGNFAHEYTHTVQYTQLNAPANVKLPCWFAEGQPQVIGQALGFENLVDYGKSRNGWISQPAGVLGDYSPESFLKFYEQTGGAGTGICNQSVRFRVYDIGYFTVEALSSIKGIQASMDLVVSVGKGNTFESSFLSAYGITWKEAAPILAKAVSRIYLER